MTIAFERVIPVFRIFSVQKAHEFCLDFLGFKVDWEARFGLDLPLYMQVSRDGLTIRHSLSTSVSTMATPRDDALCPCTYLR